MGTDPLTTVELARRSGHAPFWCDERGDADASADESFARFEGSEERRDRGTEDLADAVGCRRRRRRQAAHITRATVTADQTQLDGSASDISRERDVRRGIHRQGHQGAISIGRVIVVARRRLSKIAEVEHAAPDLHDIGRGRRGCIDAGLLEDRRPGHDCG